jgi:asparagine synthase (glutamine-hydrolysing)
MSAIFGTYSTEGSLVLPEELDRLKTHLSIRGPDASGVWQQPGIALGNCLLRTTPESVNELMPFQDNETDCCITSDARLDHRDELIAKLGLPSIRAKSFPDSRLILEAFKKWDEDCPSHLLGDFAFAIWDHRNRKLFCARDSFGVKPLYYSQVGHRLAFCSCQDGLLRLPWIPRRLNERRIASHLTTFFGDIAETFFEDIFRLPPGHVLIADHRGTAIHRYWALEQPTEMLKQSDAVCVEGFLDLFRNAVKSRLRANVKVGSMLSGGLDSSSIAATAGQLLDESGRGPLATFSAIFDQVPRSDERKYISAAVQRGGFQPNYLAADRCDPFQAPPEVENTQADVHGAANAFLNWGLYGMARERGVRVLLDGFDGDSTISHGVGFLQELARTNRWLALTRLMPAAARACHCSAASLWWAYVWHLGLAPRASRKVIKVARSITRRWNRCLPTKKATSPLVVLNGRFAERVGVRQYQAERRATALAPAQTEGEAHHQTLTWGVMPATLEMLDQAAAPFGIELRFPFWDRRLIEFCLRIPGHLKIHGGYTRWILRRAMEGILPREIQWRPGKTNLGYGFKHCLLTHGMRTLEDAITSASASLRPYICPNHFKTSLRRFRHRKGDEETLFLWQVANLARWMTRTFSQP